MHRRRYLAAWFGLGASIVGLPGASAATRQEIDTESDPDWLRFEGHGASVTEQFELEGGVTIVEAAHDGESNFVVELVPTDDGVEELLVNAIGDYDGAAGVLVDEGPYLLDVEADGSWELEILQPRATPEETDPLPVDFEGTGPTWAGPVLFDGRGRAHGTHEDDGNFIVEILPPNGRVSELVFNERDRFVGETTFDADDVGYVTVEAGGPWSLVLEGVLATRTRYRPR